MFFAVSSADDPRLSPYRALKDNARARDGGFLVEGRIALERLIAGSRFPALSLLLSESRIAPLADVLAGLDPQIPVYVAPQSVMDSVAGLPMHRGVLALAQRTSQPAPAQVLASLGSRPVTLLALVGLANTDNVGACFRNAAAFGADAVLLDETCCDPLYRKAIRVASGHTLSVPFAQSGDGAAMLDALDAAGVETWALSPSGGEPLQALAPPSRLAILLGAEGPGLPAGLMARARRVSIPMADGVDSLNVATAGAIALAHVFAAGGRLDRRTSDSC